MTRSLRLIAASSDAGLRVDQFLARKIPEVSRSQVQRLIRSGHIRTDRAAAKPSSIITAGVTVDVEIPPPAAATPAAKNLPIEVLYDDDAIVVVNKPAGMVVHPSAGHAGGTLVNAL